MNEADAIGIIIAMVLGGMSLMEWTGGEDWFIIILFGFIPGLFILDAIFKLIGVR